MVILGDGSQIAIGSAENDFYGNNFGHVQVFSNSNHPTGNNQIVLIVISYQYILFQRPTVI